MSLKNIQEQVDEWIVQYKVQYWQPHEILARIVEEVGEIAREINHLYGPKQRKAGETTKGLGIEIADEIFALCCLANSKGIDLDKSFQEVMSEKCYGRDRDRFERS